MIAVRYADDLVVGFKLKAEARRFWDAMRKRFEQFLFELHGEKTRLLEFGHYAVEPRQRNGQGKPQTFNFLGSAVVAGPRQCRQVQPGFEVYIAEALGHVAVDAGHPGQQNILAHYALGDLQRTAELAVAQPGLQVREQCVSDLSHRGSVGWHRLGPQKAVSLRAGDSTAVGQVWHGLGVSKHHPISKV